METKQIKDLSASLKSYHEAVETKMKGYEAEIKSLKDALAEMQTEKTKAGGSPIGGLKSTEDWTEIKSVIYGEKKTATVSNPPNGGIGAIPTFMSEVIKAVEEVNPLFADAHKVSIDGNIAAYIKQVAQPEAEWVGETETRNTQDAKYTSVEIPINKASACVPISNELLQDSNWVNIQQDIISQVSDQFNTAIGRAILSGNGVKKPLGVTETKGINSVTTGGTDTVTITKLREAMAAVPIALQSGCKWYMDLHTLGVIEETYKDDHVVTHGVGEAYTTSIFGHPVQLMDLVPPGTNSPLKTSGKPAIIYGNMGKYEMPIKGGLEFVRDDLTGAQNDIVKFWAKQRVGGQLVEPKAVTVMKVGA